MDNEPEWLAVPDVADALGVSVMQVRELLRERHLVAVRRGPNGALAIPAATLVEANGRREPLATLRGTLTVLGDAGLDDEECVAWLFASNDQLGEAPIDALRSGKKAPVRRAAQTLF